MAAVTVCSDFGAQEKKICVTAFTFPPCICHEVMERTAMILVFGVFFFLRFKSALHSPLSLSSGDSLVPLHFLLLRVVVFAYLRLLILVTAFFPGISIVIPWSVFLFWYQYHTVLFSVAL